MTQSLREAKKTKVQVSVLGRKSDTLSFVTPIKLRNLAIEHRRLHLPVFCIILDDVETRAFVVDRDPSHRRVKFDHAQQHEGKGRPGQVGRRRKEA